MHSVCMRTARVRKSGALRLLGVLMVLAMRPTNTVAVDPAPVAPASATRPVVILLPGADGPDLYRGEAERISRMGYLAVLLDHAVSPVSRYGEQHVRDEIARALRSPNARAGKVVVIGFSQGGGQALAHATAMPDVVAAVIAYYPYVGFIGGEPAMKSFASHFAVPVLTLAGDADRFLSCCVPEAQRALEQAARGQGKQYELVLYPGAQHQFNVPGAWYAAAAAADATRRADAMLKRYLPIEGAASVPADRR